MFKGIDFSSDTVTQPTQAMKQTMMQAPLGDEQKGEDPTTRELEELVAKTLGKETALFFPSATMANQIALRLLCDPGDELIAAENCHLFGAEAGGPAIHSGIMARPIKTPTGIFKGEEVEAIYRWSKGPHYPVSKCVSVENTTNNGGGIAWPLETLRSVLQAAKKLQLKTHLDGARLFNAAVKLNVTPRELAADFDTITICLSKGLGCAAGAVLAFNKEAYPKVRRLKQLMGGSLRQSGILAAAGIYALQNHVQRLAQDHENALRLATQLATQCPEISVETHPLSTNMVFFEWHGRSTPAEFNQQCADQGVRFLMVSPNRFRAVTHLGISAEDIDVAVSKIKKIAHA